MDTCWESLLSETVPSPLYANAISPLILTDFSTPSSKVAATVSMTLAFRPGPVKSGCLPCRGLPKLVALRMDCVSLVAVPLASLARVCKTDGLELMLLLAPCNAGDGGKCWVGSATVRDPDASDDGRLAPKGTYIVFLTSLRPRTVPVRREDIDMVLRVFATFEKAALLSSGSSSAIGLF